MKLTAAILAAAALVGGAAATDSHNSSPERADRPAVPGAWPVPVYHPSGLVKIGVHDEGMLNIPGTIPSVEGTTVIGLRYIDVNNALGRGANVEYESTSAGCTCEGWGAAFTSSAGTESGYANDASGVNNIGSVDMLMSSDDCMSSPGPSTCQYAKASAVLGGCLRVTHEYKPSTASDNAITVTVGLSNECAEPITDLWYQRSMDWDIEPDAFNERVINNPGTAVDLQCLHDDGFCSGDPLDSSCTGINGGCAAPGGGEVDTGVDDHGATFRFKFASITAATPLAQGETYTFKTHYGAAATSDEARIELGKLDVEAYSLGEYAGSSGVGPTHFFGFSGIGGTIIDLPTDDSFLAECGNCDSTTVSADGTSVTLEFGETGPFTATCA